MFEAQERQHLELSALTNRRTQVSAQLTGAQLKAVHGESTRANVAGQTIDRDTRNVAHEKAPVRWRHA